MIFLQGAARPNGPAAACLELAQQERVTLHLSPRLLTEIRDVLTRPKIQRKYPVLTLDYVDRFLVKVLSKAIVMEEVPRVFQYERDSKDEPYLNLAIAAEAQYLVSRDNDLLDLMNENDAAGQELRAQLPTLMILAPAAFLNRVRLLTEPDEA